MCGRFAQTDPIAQAAEQFLVDDIITDLPPSYNIAPGQRVAAVTRHDGRRVLLDFTWGLVPPWQKKAMKPFINARAETAREKPSFRSAYKNRRCLIIASGFYEWMKTGEGKIPLYIALKSRTSFAMAGLYESAPVPQGSPHGTCTILTTVAAASLESIHDRMPVILSSPGEEQWLDPEADPELLAGLLVPYRPEEIAWHRVSTAVNSPRNNSPQCIAPAAQDA